MEKEQKKELEAVKEEKQIKPIITSRVLFISVLDKIYMICLLLMLLSLTFRNFSGNISSLNYGFFSRVGKEILILIGMFVLYLFCNWLYKCKVKTVLCLTDTQVYKESYIPFHRWELSIPLNKITGVNTYKFLWIFRCIVIHQYGKFPVLFWTYTAQEFKDELTKLITKDKYTIENIYEDKDIVTKDKYKNVEYLGIGLLCIIILIGIVRFFSYMFSPEKKLVGTYTYSEESIVLNNDGTCDMTSIRSNSSDCSWTYDKEESEIEVKYSYTTYYYGNSTSSIDFIYNKDNKTLTYSNKEYKKQ